MTTATDYGGLAAHAVEASRHRESLVPLVVAGPMIATAHHASTHLAASVGIGLAGVEQAWTSIDRHYFITRGAVIVLLPDGTWHQVDRDGNRVAPEAVDA